MNLTPTIRKIHSTRLRVREAKMFATAMRSPRHPIMAHIIPIRRCNLSCAYCNEFDNFSAPVPLAEMLRRIVLLADLGTASIIISGGEPLLHPEIEEIIRHIRSRGIIAGIITNGYLLTPDRIKGLNRAGLDHLQISIDNVKPDDVSKKSLKVLDKKLQSLAALAKFNVNINSVVGSSINNPKDAVAVARRVRELGFTGTVGIIHDHSGQLKPLQEEQVSAYEEIVGMSKNAFNNFAYYNQFQRNLIQAQPNEWHCRAGSRYLYICEEGLVHYCSQQRGYPGIPLEDYSNEDLEREYNSVKPCAPYCTISCVHQISLIDSFREKPLEVLGQLFPSEKDKGESASMPLGVKVLTALLLPRDKGGKRSFLTKVFRSAALRLLGVR